MDGVLGTPAANWAEGGALGACYAYDKYLARLYNGSKSRALKNNADRADYLAKQFPVFQAI